MMDAFQWQQDWWESERQFTEMKSSMEYGNGWLEKIHLGMCTFLLFHLSSCFCCLSDAFVFLSIALLAQARCINTCFSGFLLSMGIAFFIEVYWNMPANASASTIVEFLLLSSTWCVLDETCTLVSHTVSSLSLFRDAITMALAVIH